MLKIKKEFNYKQLIKKIISIKKTNIKVKLNNFIKYIKLNQAIDIKLYKQYKIL